MKICAVICYEASDDIGRIPLFRTTDERLIRLIAQRVVEDSERAAGALQAVDDVAAFAARWDAESARVCLEVIGPSAA